jgi:hypothetical protein
MGSCRKRKQSDVTSSSSASSLQDVIVPFRERIPAETSTFSIQVPRQYAPNRLFYFSRLFLSPNLFNVEAKELKLEANAEDQLAAAADYNFEVNLTAQFPNVKAFFPNAYNNKLPATDTFITSVNQYFDSQKPEFALQCPFFFDWVDLNNRSEHDYETYARFTGMIFYNEPYDKAKHAGNLPQSVATMEGVNDLKNPIHTMNEALAFARFRYRLWLAPYTRITFSSESPLVDLGFTPEQFGARTVMKQIEIVNPTYRYRVWNVGVNMPSKLFTKWDFKMTASPFSAFFYSARYPLQLSPEKWDNSEELGKILANVVKKLATDINVSISFEYDANSFKFIVKFPAADTVLLFLNLTNEVCARLGYSGVAAIHKGSTPEPVAPLTAASAAAAADQTSTDAQKKCVSICYDTGLVIVSLEQTRANSTCGIDDYHMASLFPHSSGTMQMAAWPNPSLAPCTAVPLSTGASTVVPLHFNLSRIYDNQTVADFAWKQEAFIYGELRGTIKGLPAGPSPSVAH